MATQTEKSDGQVGWVVQKCKKIAKMVSAAGVGSITIFQSKTAKENRIVTPSSAHGSNKAIAWAWFILKIFFMFLFGGAGLVIFLIGLAFISLASSGIKLPLDEENFSALLISATQNFFDNKNNIAAPAPGQMTKASPIGHSQEQFGWEEAENEFMSFVHALKTKYGSQSEYGLDQIDAAISSTMTEQRPGKPTCLVFLTPPAVPASFTSCYAREIGRNVNNIFSKLNKNEMHPVLELRPDYWETVSSVSQVHRDLDTYFETRGKVVIMYSVDKLKTQDQLRILHAYCDNAKAPDTRATLLFPIKVEQDYEDQVVGGLDWKEGNGYRIAKAILNSAWTSLSNDARPAIIDRVTATVVLIRPGDECHSA